MILGQKRKKVQKVLALKVSSRESFFPRKFPSKKFSFLKVASNRQRPSLAGKPTERCMVKGYIQVSLFANC